MIKWFEEQKKASFSEFNEEDISECIAYAQGRVEKKWREAENAER